MTRKRLFASVPHSKTFLELLEDYHRFPTIDCQIETAQEENLCWTLLPIENANLTLQSLSSFNIRYLKISCTFKEQESPVNTVSLTPTRNAFTVLWQRRMVCHRKGKAGEFTIKICKSIRHYSAFYFAKLKQMKMGG